MLMVVNALNPAFCSYVVTYCKNFVGVEISYTHDCMCN
jgi:hypothetical protein